MTEKKNPRNETVDWAERLKASMNAEPAEAPVRATAPAAEEDDLAALLDSPRACAMRDGFLRGEAAEDLCRRCGYAAARGKKK